MRTTAVWRGVAARAGAVWTATTLLVLAGGCGTIDAWSTPSSPTVVIGVDLNLTGPGPGVAYDNGLRLAVEQVNQQQLAGERRIELRVLDNRGDPATAAQHLSQLSSDPQVAAIVTAGCPQCIIDAAATLTFPVIALEGLDAVAAPASERHWVFRLGPNAAANADALSLAMAQAGVETVGVIAVADPYGQEGLRWVQEAAERDGMEVVTTATVAPAAGEAAVAEAAQAVAGWQPPFDPFASPAPDQQQTGPDAVVVWTYAPQAALVAAALREAGYSGQLFVDMIAADEVFLSGEASALQGARLVFTTSVVADLRIASSPAATARQEWVQAYAARYQTYHVHSVWAADAVLVLADAISRAEGTDRAAIRDRIESTRLDGITGPIRFTADQHSGLSPNALLVLAAEGDRWQ